MRRRNPVRVVAEAFSGRVNAFPVRRWSFQAHVGLRRAILWAPALLLFALLVGTGLRGLDYGEHWDEGPGQLQPVRAMVASGIFLPHAPPYSYNYPAVCRWLVLAPAVPAGIAAAMRSNLSPDVVKSTLLATLDAPAYLLTLRAVFLVLSASVVLWVYGAALELRLRPWAATAAAASVALSWEYAYHARFVATDCLLASLVAATLFVLARYLAAPRPRLLRTAAVLVGLAMGTKYPGAFLLVPLLLAANLAGPAPTLWRRCSRAAALCALAFASYLVTTPGTLLDPWTFITDLRLLTKYYASATHAGYTAADGTDHAGMVLGYLALSFFSPYRVLALVAFVASLFGVMLWARRDPRVWLVLVTFPLVFLLAFCSRYRLVVVRNYLCITPILALGLGHTVELGGVYAAGRSRALERGLRAVLVAAFALNAVFLVRAAESIRRVSPVAAVRQALKYVAAHAPQSFRVSPQVRRYATEAHLGLPKNARVSGQAEHVVFFGRAEAPWKWPPNDPFRTEAVFGPLEVNFDYYPTWAGHDRVLVMTHEKARLAGVPLAR